MKILPYTEGQPMTREQAVTLFSEDLKRIANSIAYKFNQYNPDDIHSIFCLNILNTERFGINSKSQLVGLAWLCMKNIAINQYRHLRKVEMTELLPEHNTLHSTIQVDLECKDFADRVVTGLETYLNSTTCLPTFREIFLNQKSYEETAECLDIPIGTVKTQVHRIREIAKERYGGAYEARG